MRRRTRIIGSLTAGLVLLIGAGVVVGAGLLPNGESHWSTAAEMRGSPEGAAVPTLVGADARDIRLRVAQFDRTGVQVRWASASGITRSDCHRGPIEGTSRAGAGWWPTAAPTEGWTCGWWTVFEEDGTFYAWHDPGTDHVT